MTRVRNRLDVLVQRALRDLERRRTPLRSPTRELLLAHTQLNRIRNRIDGNLVPVAHERDRPADLRIGDDVPDDEPARRAGESAVRDESGLTAEACAHERTGRAQHLLV